MKEEIQSKLEQILSQFLYEEDNPITRGNIKRILNSYLNGLVIRRKIKTFKVNIDVQTSMSNELYIGIVIVPMQSIQNIQINLQVKSPV